MRMLPLLLLLSAPAQELSKDVLDRTKGATVFVVASEGSGSGFLFLKRGTSGYILTCEHVVRGVDDVKVVFSSGQGNERSFQAKVVATDPDRDLACLTVKNAKDLPSVLEIGQKTTVTETEAVYAAGFPFGKYLAADAKNPEISISKASVSSIRKDNEGRILAVQMGGDINPGNSGGPVIDKNGKVVGVAQSKVSGTSTCFAVPPEEMHGFLRGRIKRASFRELSATATAVKYELTVDLVDPLASLRGVSMAWVPTSLLPAEPEPDKDGRWQKIHGSMRSVALKIDEEIATATFEVTRAAADPQSFRIAYQITYTAGDGKPHWTQPAPLEVAFADANAPKPNPDPPKPVNPDPPKPDPKAVDVPVADTIKIAAMLRLQAVVADLFLAPDGSALYALDLSDGRVYKLNPDTLEITAQCDAVDNAVAMCLTPDGKTLYVGARDPRSDYYGKGNGTIQVIPTSSMKTSSSFAVPVGICDLESTNGGMIAASVTGQSEGIAIIDASKKTVDGTCRIYGGSFVRIVPDGSRFYCGDTGLSPSDFRCIYLKKDKNGQFENYDSKYHGDHPFGGNFQITPDSRFIIGCYGGVARLGKTRETDLQYVTKIDPCSSIGVGKGAKTFVTCTSEGFLKVYDLEGFELKKSVKIDRLLPRMVLDAARGRLYAFATATSTERYDRTVRAGDIVSYSLSGK